MDEKALFERLDRIIALLEKVVKESPLVVRVANGVATGVGIMSILAVIEIIRSWITGG